MTISMQEIDANGCFQYKDVSRSRGFVVFLRVFVSLIKKRFRNSLCLQNLVCDLWDTFVLFVFCSYCRRSAVRHMAKRSHANSMRGK